MATQNLKKLSELYTENNFNDDTTAAEKINLLQEHIGCICGVHFFSVKGEEDDKRDKSIEEKLILSALESEYQERSGEIDRVHC